MSNLAKWIGVLTLAISAAFAAALETGGKPEGETFFNEYSQERVAEQQFHQAEADEQGVVPEDPDRVRSERVRTDGRAAGMLSDAAKQKAKDNLVAAEQREDRGFNFGRLLWPALGLIAAVLAVVGFKVWAAKAVPVPDRLNRP